MEALLQWLDDPAVFRKGQIAAHSDHKCYRNEGEYREKNSSLLASLNGDWQFCYSTCAKERPADFYREDAKLPGFTSIRVPGHIELSGFDQIHYINTMYPWEGRYYRRPAGALPQMPDGAGSFADAPENPVGSYRKTFDVPEKMKGMRISVFFEGVEQAMYLWINGIFLGYAEDSFTPAEFDLTPHLKDKGNVLAAEVHKRSSAAYLENQDFFRFFGIFRDVSLVARPKVHVEDLFVQALLHEDNATGTVRVNIRLSGEHGDLASGGAGLALTMKDKNGAVVFQEKRQAAGEGLQISSETLYNLTPWSSAVPALYEVVVKVLDGSGEIMEIASCQTGFRRVEALNKVLHLNGSPLRILGVNRHEWSASGGRCITREDMEWDIAEMKKLHINAVRTSHYPNQAAWYGLCDEAGIYVMAENNLESHGSWQKMNACEPSWNVPGDSKLWTPAVIDRARNNFELLKNHPSILFWSLGNESYAGEAIAKMQQYYKEKDDGRLVHYEGVSHNPSLKGRISEFESRMYASPAEAEEYLKNQPKKPYLLCEYMHCMGNSVGGLGAYMALFDNYPEFAGGFIWDYIDQALYVTDETTGRKVLRYGGDFDDKPSDYEFSGNGILFADRSEKPAAQEVKYYYEKYEA